MREKAKNDPLTVATGGLASLIFKQSETINEIDEFLTLKGLRLLYEKSKDHHKFK